MEKQINTQETTKTMKKKKKNTDRVKHQDLSKMEEQIEEEASFCSLLTVPRAGILWRFCEKYSYFFAIFWTPYSVHYVQTFGNAIWN